MSPPDTGLAFKAAMEARDAAAVHRCLAPDVRFHSPIRYTPFEGRDAVAAVLQIPAAVFVFRDGFRYTRVFSAGNDRALFFEAEIDGRSIEGVDLLRLDHHGLVAELWVMMRPLAEIQRFAVAAAEIIRQQTRP
jgi:SnoaL-like domain